MFDPVVETLIRDNEDSRMYHEQNMCSSCKHACWTATKHSTYPNSGTMHDYMRFLMHGAEDVGKATGKYRCRCLVQNEYMEFAWFEEGMDPHIVDGCSKFEEYELEGTPKRPEQRPRPGKRERQDPMDKDAAGKEPSL